MTQVAISGHVFDIDMIAFDKDGTLIELDIWSQLFEQWGKLLQARLSLSDSVLHKIYTDFGYDAKNQRLLPDTPASVSSVEQSNAILSFLLYQQGIGWTAAETAIKETGAQLQIPEISPSNIRFIGDVPEALQRLREAGLKIGVITSDNRSMTERMLHVLDIEHLVDVVVCGDDPIPMKPAPDGLLHMSEVMDIPPERILMVGDSNGDMQCGRAAGVAGCVRIDDPHTGAEGEDALVDVRIQSVEEIRLLV
ncbi:MAG: HAD-IA family hydrolase [Chloroflexota bacterium]